MNTAFIDSWAMTNFDPHYFLLIKSECQCSQLILQKVVTCKTCSLKNGFKEESLTSSKVVKALSYSGSISVDDQIWVQLRSFLRNKIKHKIFVKLSQVVVYQGMFRNTK